MTYWLIFNISFVFDENPNVASAGLGGVVIGGARKVLYGTALDVRATGAVGLRCQAVFGSSTFEIDRLRSQMANSKNRMVWRGAGWQAIWRDVQDDSCSHFREMVGFPPTSFAGKGCASECR